MNSTWKNLCPYRNLLSEKRTASTRTGSASHLLRKRTFFFYYFSLLHTGKSVNSLIQWLSVNGMSTLSEAILLGWPQCAFAHWLALLFLMLSRLSWNCGYQPTVSSTWAVMYISARSFWCLENIYANAFLYAFSYQLTEGIRATERQSLILINIFSPYTPLNPARRRPAIQ